MTIYAGTRKGLFQFDKNGSGWHQTREWFLGDSVPAVLSDDRDQMLYVAVEHGHFGTKMHRSKNAGDSWEELDPPQYPAKPTEVPDTLCPMRQIVIPWSLEKIWELTPGGKDQSGVLWCGTIPGGLFHSADHGESWSLNHPLWERPERSQWCGGGYDYPGIHSIAISPEDPDDIVVGVSCGGVWQSTDGGRNWAQRAHGMFYDFNPEKPEDNPEAQDPHRVVRCASAPDQMWSQHHCGIFKADGLSEGWRRCEDVAPSGFGFAVAVHPTDPDIAWFVPAVKDEWRYPVDGQLVVTRTRDGGRSFESISTGLPPGKAYDLIYRHGLAVDSSGEVLVMGSTTGALWVSENGGDSWQILSVHLPPVYCVQFGST